MLQKFKERKSKNLADQHYKKSTITTLIPNECVAVCHKRVSYLDKGSVNSYRIHRFLLSQMEEF